jgi:hypothetical protein
MSGWLKSTNGRVYGEERPRMAGFSVMLLPKNILESAAIVISASMKYYRAVMGKADRHKNVNITEGPSCPISP